MAEAPDLVLFRLYCAKNHYCQLSLHQVIVFPCGSADGTERTHFTFIVKLFKFQTLNVSNRVLFKP